MLEPGTNVGRFVIEGPAGQEGRYVAFHPELGFRVAIERIAQRVQLPAVHEDMWRAAAALKHPNIVSLIEFFVIDAQLYVVSERVLGHTLEEVLKKGFISLDQRLWWMEELCRGVAHAHQMGVCHGSISPASLIVADHGRLQIAAFGFAALRAKAARRSREFGGAAGYLAPEQRGGAQPDERSDLFSIGAVCYELLSSRKAFPGDTAVEIAANNTGTRGVKRSTPAPLGVLVPQIGPTLADAIDRTVSIDPGDRLLSASLLGAIVASARRPIAGDHMLSEPARPQAGALLGADVPFPPVIDTVAAARNRLSPVKGSTPLEQVQFTVYRPKSIRPREWKQLLAFMHLADRRPGTSPDEPSPAERVRTLAESMLGSEAPGFGTITADARQGVPPEGEITFIPSVPGIEFNPERRVFRWVEDVHQEDFLLRAGAELDRTVARGSLAVFSGALLIADVDISIRVDSGLAARAPSEPVTAAPYRKIFASYSHKDGEIVLQFERYVQSLGDTYLRDVRSLRSGETWSERLLTLIDEADVFQLFWSTNAMRSPEVRREWEHALALGRPAFVRPTYWENPMPASIEEDLPPEALRRLQFHRLCVPEEPRMMPVGAGASAATQPGRKVEIWVQRRGIDPDAIARHRTRMIEQALAEARRQIERGEFEHALAACAEASTLDNGSLGEHKARIDAARAELERAIQAERKEVDARRREEERLILIEQQPELVKRLEEEVARAQVPIPGQVVTAPSPPQPLKMTSIAMIAAMLVVGVVLLGVLLKAC
jgi:hypothetical protein